MKSILSGSTSVGIKPWLFGPSWGLDESAAIPRASGLGMGGAAALAAVAGR